MQDFAPEPVWVCLVSRAPVVFDSVDVRVGQNLHVLCGRWGAFVCPIGSSVSKHTVNFGYSTVASKSPFREYRVAVIYIKKSNNTYRHTHNIYYIYIYK